MTNHDMLTDDYVAELISKEASDCSLKYSTMGLEAFNTKKKPANMPKPNTRFLRHIIKDTDTHNKNLLAKEAAESQARLKVLENAEEKERRKRAGPQDIRKRQMGDIKAILGGRQERSRTADRSHRMDASSPRRRHRDRRSESPERRHRRHHRKGDESDSEREDRRRHKSDRRESRSPDDRSRRHRHRSPLGKGSASRSHRSEKGRRDEDDADLMSKSLKPRINETRETRGFSIKGSSRHAAQEQDSAAASDSDPLDDFIGPAPPAPFRSRGRGAASTSSGIDKRFEADYDPKMDVEMDSTTTGDADNWDDAVEAFRDRQKWRQNQEQRMRAAGYDEEVIKKWRTGEQKDERDVRWAKAGEKREWDRGKEDGISGLFSEFN